MTNLTFIKIIIHADCADFKIHGNSGMIDDHLDISVARRIFSMALCSLVFVIHLWMSTKRVYNIDLRCNLCLTQARHKPECGSYEGHTNASRRGEEEEDDEEED